MDETHGRLLAIDLPEGRQNLIWATHAAPAADLLTQKIAGTAAKPSWYVVAKEDRVAHPRCNGSARSA